MDDSASAGAYHRCGRCRDGCDTRSCAREIPGLCRIEGEDVGRSRYDVELSVCIGRASDADDRCACDGEKCEIERVEARDGNRRRRSYGRRSR